jgi:Sulfotransferase family
VAAPVIVLTYAHAGAQLLNSALSASRALACTSATGLLPLCHEAVSTWQQAEDRNGPPSLLAISSVRALATTMITVIQARCGTSRWCETAFTPPAVAETFLQVFPEARFLCLHRSLRGVLGEAARAYPWGLGGSPFWAYAAPHPGNNAATIAAYWAARTGALLDFEAEQPGSCLRVRYEDLAADRGHRVSQIFAALGLEAPEPAVPRQQEEDAAAGAEPGPPVPPDRIPPELLAKVRDLHIGLDYDPWPQ